MPSTSRTLYDMIGEVKHIKRNASPEFVTGRLNSRIRELIDARPYWADLGEMRIIAVPDDYDTGTIAVTSGSASIVGTGTAWPVADIVNTTIPDGVTATGYCRIYPLSMVGISEDSILYVDASGVPEAVAVVEVFDDSFIASFRYTHNPLCTLTQSSLVGRQFKVADEPLFDVRAIVSVTELLIETTWGSVDSSDLAYSIFKNRFNIGSDVRMIHGAQDTRQGRPLARDITAEHLQVRDPRRDDAMDPIALVDYQAGPNRAMLYELWPRATSARQIQVFISKQWPEMKERDDRPPPFINPQIIIDGATADALRQRVDADDPYFNPNLAREFDAKFNRGFVMAVNADSGRHMRDLQTRAGALLNGGFGGNWDQTHLVMADEYDGGYW